MWIRLLGTVSVLGTDGAELRVAGLRLRGLLARLALDAGRVVDTATLVDALWGETPPATPNALQSLVTRLRRVLGPDRVVGAAGGYRLAVAPDRVDALRFAELRAGAAGEADPRRARELLAGALALWAGAPLADLRELPFAGPVAVRLADARATAAEELAGRGLADGAPGAGLDTLTAVLDDHPLRESAAVALARSLHATGRRADALDVLDRTRTALATELGVDPGPELRHARAELLHDAPDTRPTAPAVTGAPQDTPEDAGPRRGDGPAARHRSPALTSFVGRADDLARLQALLGAARLVTVTGPGGTGKTRIVEEVLRRSDGAAAVAELAPLTGTDQVAAAVLHAVGGPDLAVADRGGSDTLARLRATLAGRELLLVLDNCEHLVAGVAELVHDLLTAVGGLRVLATSREPLGVPGEHLLPLGALDDEQAARLFTDRAAAVVPGFDPGDGRTVAALCRRLDGQPLPIELAAARVRTLSTGEILARLDDRFRLLVGGARTALPRHRTLRAVVDWSWDLLEDPERTLARRFGIFAGAVDAAAVRAVCGASDPGGDPWDLLAALVEKSLVVAVAGTDGAPTRYRMLETVREYSLARLAESAEEQWIAGAHGDWVLGVLEPGEPRLRTGAQLDWLGVVRSVEGEAVRALDRAVDAGRADRAHRLLAALSWGWLIRGEQPTLLHRSATVAALPAAGTGPAGALNRTMHALLLAGHGDTGTVRADIDAVLDAIGDLPRPLHPVVALAGPVSRAFTDGDESDLLTLAAGDGDPWLRAAAAEIVALGAENRGDLDVQRTHLRIAHRLFGEVGDRFGLGVVVLSLGELEDFAGDRAAAAAAYREAIALTSELGNLDDLPQYRMQLAHVTARDGDAATARQQMRQALVDLGDRPQPETPGWFDWGHADVERRLGNPHRALELLDTVWEPVPPGPGLLQRDAVLHMMAAAVELDLGRPQRARPLLDHAADAALASEDGPVLGQVAETAARWALAEGDPDRAGELLGIAIDRRGTLHLGDPEVVATRDGVRAALGPERTDAALARGRAVPRDVAPRPRPATAARSR
ncbi:AfsR/SARP family transcriptional regulator [Pseudonocardia sp. HH130630-07]|uniref:AfsR/SARP family transcriptional regulator n=1 Tax=Pseudonocardia sp. HH130630-07 TaxID=1690815 RepID=UPI000814BC20|nr:BTAD domain-containing putative transcriptional regulator [Pseudonocardia sp. HH130630-07]ANY06098.1 hypothetical protein AFB00_07065 [Pseudonocardia sp. HH130630-07]